MNEDVYFSEYTMEMKYLVTSSTIITELDFQRGGSYFTVFVEPSGLRWILWYYQCAWAEAHIPNITVYFQNPSSYIEYYGIFGSGAHMQWWRKLGNFWVTGTKNLGLPPRILTGFYSIMSYFVTFNSWFFSFLFLIFLFWFSSSLKFCERGRPPH